MGSWQKPHPRATCAPTRGTREFPEILKGQPAVVTGMVPTVGGEPE